MTYNWLQDKERVEEQLKLQQKNKPGYDGRWYTDINGDQKTEAKELTEEEQWEKEKKEFWEEPTPYTPESRKQVRCR